MHRGQSVTQRIIHVDHVCICVASSWLFQLKNDFVAFHILLLCVLFIDLMYPPNPMRLWHLYNIILCIVMSILLLHHAMLIGTN